MVASQTKGIRVIAYNGPPTALAAKSRRFHSTNTIPPIPNPPYHFNSMDEVVERRATPAESASSPAAHSSSTPTQAIATALKTSHDALEAESQRLRQSFVVQNQGGKSTGDTYG
jgi:hypothetical protein